MAGCLRSEHRDPPDLARLRRAARHLIHYWPKYLKVGPRTRPRFCPADLQLYAAYVQNLREINRRIAELRNGARD